MRFVLAWLLALCLSVAGCAAAVAATAPVVVTPIIVAPKAPAPKPVEVAAGGLLIGRPGDVWYVSSTGAGLANGTSLANAWAGFDNVTVGSAGWGPGDTLYVCGTNIFNLNVNWNSASAWITSSAGGTSSAQAIMDGNCPGNPGIVVGSRQILSTDGWTDLANGSFRIAQGNSGNSAYEAPTVGSGTETWLRSVAIGSAECADATACIAYVAANDGSFFNDQVGNFAYYNPIGATVKNIYYGGIDPLWVFSNYTTFQNLTIRGGGTGSIRLGHSTVASDTKGIIIQYNNIGFDTLYAIPWETAATGSLDGLTVVHNVFHDLATGTYWLSANTTVIQNINVSFNEFYTHSEPTPASPGPGDRQAVGGQAGTHVVMCDNNIHDWYGDGVNIWVGGVSRDTTDVEICRNTITNLNDPANLNLHRAIALSGNNFSTLGDLTKNWRIHDNIVSNCGGDLADQEGIAFRIKGILATVGPQVPPLVQNNTVSDCNFGLFVPEVTGFPNAAVTFTGNTMGALKVGGTQIFIDNLASATDLSKIVINSNAFTGGLFEWRTQSPTSSYSTFTSQCNGAGGTCGP